MKRLKELVRPVEREAALGSRSSSF